MNFYLSYLFQAEKESQQLTNNASQPPHVPEDEEDMFGKVIEFNSS